MQKNRIQPLSIEPFSHYRSLSLTIRPLTSITRTELVSCFHGRVWFTIIATPTRQASLLDTSSMEYHRNLMAAEAPEVSARRVHKRALLISRILVLGLCSPKLVHADKISNPKPVHLLRHHHHHRRSRRRGLFVSRPSVIHTTSLKAYSNISQHPPKPPPNGRRKRRKISFSCFIFLLRCGCCLDIFSPVRRRRRRRLCTKLTRASIVKHGQRERVHKHRHYRRRIASCFGASQPTTHRPTDHPFKLATDTHSLALSQRFTLSLSISHASGKLRARA